MTTIRDECTTPEQRAARRKIRGDPLWWQELAACRNADDSIFITFGDRDDDPWYPSDEALAFCNICPVRVVCLDWALVHKELGTWGGTSEYQRRQLRRTRSRSTCPSCGSHDITTEDQYEICLSCAVSWPTLPV